MYVHLEAGAASKGGRLSACCGLSQGREDCGRGWGFSWDGLNVRLGAGAASKGGQAKCTLWALLGPRGLWKGGGDLVRMACE